LSYRIAVAPFAFLNYLGKIFWPHHLTVGYPFLAQPPFWITMGSCLLIIVISMAILSAFNRYPYLLIGWLWYSITILPIIGIIPIGDPMADRYIYLPSIGIGIMMAWGMPDLMENRNLRKKILLPAALIFFIIMSGLTWKQCGYWKNNFILFSHALRVTKNNFMAHGHLGMALFEAGKAEEAMGHYQEAIRVKPNYVNAYNNRGIAYANLGRFRLAVEDFTKAINLQSNCAQAYYNRGNLYYKFGQYQQAVHDYNAVIRLRPEHLESYYNRGLAYIHLGQYRLAVNNFNQAVQLKPDYADAWNNRAFVYLSLGNIASGCHDAQKACALGVCATLNAARGRGYCR
jgi:tetratricopeptide (TPR) repeat protein